MECNFITIHHFGHSKFVIFKSWEKVTEKYTAMLFVFGSYMLQNFVPTLLISNISTQFYTLLSLACLTDGQHDWFVWTVDKNSWNFIHLNFSDWSSPSSVFLTNAASLTKQIYAIYKQHFYWCVPSKHHTKSLHCNHRSRFVKPWHCFSFFYLRWNFVTVVLRCKYLYSSNTNNKLEYITSLNMFNFHSCVFLFMSSVAEKLYRFHMCPPAQKL
jgi:hypothetical protein